MLLDALNLAIHQLFVFISIVHDVAWWNSPELICTLSILPENSNWLVHWSGCGLIMNSHCCEICLQSLKLVCFLAFFWSGGKGNPKTTQRFRQVRIHYWASARSSMAAVMCFSRKASLVATCHVRCSQAEVVWITISSAQNIRLHGNKMQ